MPRAYLIFFDWDRSDLRPDALAIVREAAENAKRGGVSHITAVGHADRSGPANYNVGLSQRRAQSVADALVDLGVPAGDIVITWRGETEPLVPTPDGVREPQNRRVEIILP